MMVFNLHLSRATTLLGAALAAFTLSSSLALANPTEQLLTRFNQAAQGDTGLVDTVHNELSQLVQKQGATPVTLVYLAAVKPCKGAMRLCHGTR